MFQVVRVDFAEPLKYRKGKNQEGKVYIALYTCSLTRGVYLELLSSLEMGEMPETVYRPTWLAREDLFGQWEYLHGSS